MGLTLGNAWVKVGTYYGSGALLQLFAIAMMYILYKKKKERNNDERFMVAYTLVFAFVYFFPVTAYIISNKMIGRDVYWRMFWLLPIEMVVAYTLTNVVNSIEELHRKLIIFAIGATVIVCLGGDIYKVDSFSDKQNWHKLDAEVLEICRIIEEDAAATGNRTEVVASSDVFEEIRIYDANITMPYGRNAKKGENMDSEKCKQLYDSMEAETLDANRLAFFVDKWDVPYVVYSNNNSYKARLESAGFVEVGEAGSHGVYRLERDYSDYWLVTQYGDPNGSQMIFYTIQNLEGYTIFVDGGTADYEDGVRYAIKMAGNEVDAWILTHYHDDHVSAFTNIYTKPRGITIKEIYAVNMASPEMIKERASWDSVDAYMKYLELDIPDVHYLSKGDELNLGGLDISVLSAYDDYVDELSNDLMNDGSLMFKIKNKEQTMLFCGDVGYKISEYLINEYGDSLKSDYVQMGHHGNGGLSDEFYKIVSPTVAFFDAPNWLMNDSKDKYTTVEKRKLMRHTLKAKVRSFATSPNSIILE